MKVYLLVAGTHECEVHYGIVDSLERAEQWEQGEGPYAWFKQRVRERFADEFELNAPLKDERK